MPTVVIERLKKGSYGVHSQSKRTDLPQFRLTYGSAL